MWTASWLLALQMTVALEPTARPKVTALEVARGRTLFEAQCAYCHGAEGDGGRGANLARAALRRAPTDEALFRVVNRGIPGTGMPGNAMSARETWQVVAFVRSLGRVKREPLPGDAARGAQVYEAVGCAACHTIRGRGGPVGPDLTDVGARSSPAAGRWRKRHCAGWRRRRICPATSATLHSVRLPNPERPRRPPTLRSSIFFSNADDS